MWRRSMSVALTAGAISAMSALVLATPSDASRGGQKVEIQDDCQPASFNAVFGAGVCVGDGETSLNAFIRQLTATKIAKDWKSDPSMLTIRGGRPVILENEGGETHSFTLVKAFGGGFIPLLNQLSGNPVPTQECATTLPNGDLAPNLRRRSTCSWPRTRKARSRPLA